MKILKATHKNMEEIVNIEMSSGYHKSPIKSDLKKFFVTFFNLTHSYAYILKDGRDGVGYFAFRKVRDCCELDYFAISKKHQGKGLGKLLLNKVILLCKKLGLHKINLSVRNSNKKAINLYKKYSFESTGKKKDKLFMERDLE
jgi:ribosomal protein S18 acetylase RimI-like enzyme